MEITEIRITISDKARIRAFVSVTFDKMLVVHGIRVLDGKKGIFVAMPSKRSGDMFKDIVHPLNTDFRKIIQEKILKEYERVAQEEKCLMQC